MEASEFRVRVDQALEEIRAEYMATVHDVEKLKEKMDELERQIGKKPKRSVKDLDSLITAMRNLDTITDSQILKSKRAWETYRELEKDCETLRLSPAQLDELYTVCNKIEKLAEDLLCFSLGHLKRVDSSLC